MPEAPATPAPAAPPAAPSKPAATAAPPSQPSGVGSAVPSSSGEIKVVPPPITPPPEPSKGSARDRMRAALRATAKDQGEEPAAPAPVKPDPKTTAPADTEQQPEGDEPEPAVEPVASPEVKGKKSKVNPWKLVDEWKAKHGELEKKLAESSKSGATVPEQDRNGYLDRIKSLEERNQTLENEMRFVDYSKSAEFTDKYQKPYEQAWQRAASELSEITVTDKSGTVRAATSNDLLQLVNLPLGQARSVADEVFGEFADDMMAHRKEIRSLFATQHQALEDARTKGSERAKLQQEQHARSIKEMNDFLAAEWKKANEEAAADETVSRFFSQRDGDDEWNQRLEKGFKFADESFSMNPMDPKLSPEDRAKIVRKHAASRNRIAAFGPMRAMIEKLEAQLKAANDKLNEFQDTVPPTTGGRAPGAEVTGPVSAMSRAKSRLRELAK